VGLRSFNNVAWVSTEIVYSRGGALWSVSEKGGATRQLTVLDTARHEVLHAEPAALPGGRVVLFSSLTTDAGTERIEAISLDGQNRSVVHRARSHAGLVAHRPPAVWTRRRRVGGAFRSEERHHERCRGSSHTVRRRVGTVRSGSLGFQLSSTGTLVFVPADFDFKRVVSVGRDGSEVALNRRRIDHIGTPRQDRTLLIGQ
jgi:hypothetical protein